jgi:ATP-dependent DNA helicase RecQ
MEPAGGRWQGIDPVSRGRVQVLPAGRDPRTQAVAVMTEFTRLAALDPAWDWTRCAVIAREWRYLDPVRAWCEANGVPVQMADESLPHFWRLRETQMLIDWVRGSASRLVDVAGVRGWLASREASPWWDLLREAFAEYVEETGGVDMPVVHFLEWLAEWGREVRRRQTGLLLLTAHRAKGLEFDHVAVLDGGWERVGKDEDGDAPRRLFYVAMTRAKETLVLARMAERHPFVGDLKEGSSVLAREASVLPAPGPELARRYVKLKLGDVDIGFAGRLPEQARIHRDIGQLQAGDALTLRVTGEVEELIAANGACVGKTARSFVPPEGMVCVAASVAAIVVRTREQTDAQYLDAIRCARWEVVVPELVFAPA